MTKVFLSPSSQEKNTGVIKGYIEETVCNLIADVVERELLRQKSYEIMRNFPNEIYSQHTQRSNVWGADLHICIHTNANNGTARGLNAGCFDPTMKQANSTKLTQAIYDQLSPLTPAADKIVKYTFTEIVGTHCPCSYLEISFHDNYEDCAWILSHIEEIGVGIAAGIVAYEKKSWVPAVVSVPEDPETINIGDMIRIVIPVNTSADGTGKTVYLTYQSAKVLKVVTNVTFPFGVCYNGDNVIDGWFSKDSIRK